MMNGLQLIVHFPLFHLVFPPNVTMLLEPLVNVANFDVLPTGLFYPYIYNFGDSEAFN